MIPTPRTPDGGTGASSAPAANPLALVALAFVLAACSAAGRRLAAERRDVVQRRLAAASELLAAPAANVLGNGPGRAELAARLDDPWATNGLRVTLIPPWGEAHSDSEVHGPIPDLGDRPVVRAAAESGSGSASRRSHVTGKETHYLARSLVVAGRRVGTLRVATQSGEIDGVLPGLEGWFAAAMVAAVALGAWIGRCLAARPAAAVAASDAGGADQPARRAA